MDIEQAMPVILCINSGSSSLKFAVYRLGDNEEQRFLYGAAERIGLSGGRLWIKGCGGDSVFDAEQDFAEHSAAAAGISAAARDLNLPAPDAAGHRVVHGGPFHTSSERVDDALLQELERLIPFAPLHLPS